MSARRKLTLVAAAVLALAFAGVAGAVTKYKIFRLNHDDSAHLDAAPSVRCFNLLSAQAPKIPGMSCYVYGAFGAGNVVPGTYAMFVTEKDVAVERVAKGGKIVVVKTYLNP